MTSPERPPTCRQCGKPLPPPQGTGRPRRYCSGTCRSAARRSRSNERAHDSGNVQSNLTTDLSKVKLDIVPNETGAGQAGAADAAVVGGRAAARALLSQLLSQESASPLDAIAFIQGAAGEIGEGMQAAVERARQAGQTWAEVGQVLGISRQAAFQRFGRPADPVTGQPMAASMLPGAAERGAALLADLAAGRWAQVGRDFDERVARQLDADGVALMWARRTGLHGRLEHTGEPLAYQAGDLTLVEIPLSFEAAERTARISYDRDGKVVGLHFLPPGLT
jgi:hypothetical protein